MSRQNPRCMSKNIKNVIAAAKIKTKKPKMRVIFFK